MNFYGHWYIITKILILDESIQENIISHEEICELEGEQVFQEEIIEDEENNIEPPVSIDILAENNEEGDENENVIVYPTTIYIKKEKAHKFTSGDDETMAVEALRQLGGMYPSFEDKKVLCSNCKNSFTQSDLPKHQATCNARKEKYGCQTCGEKFERKIDLNNHMVCHQVDKSHACRTCGNLFRSKSSLQVHMVEVHQVEKPHKCFVSGADFQRPSSLSNHMKIHSYVAGRALMKNLSNNSNLNSNTIKIVEVDQDTNTLSAVPNFEVPHIQWVQAYNIQTDNHNEIMIQQEKMDTLQEFTVLPNGEVAQIEFTSHGNSHNQQYTLTPFNNSLIKVEALINHENGNANNFIEVNLQENNGYTCSHCGSTFARQ